MKQYTIITTLLLLLFVSGCGQSEQHVDFSEQAEAVLSYSSPSDNELDVSVDSEIVLTFTHDILDESLLDHIRLIDEDGNEVAVGASIHPANSKMIVISPVQPLEEGKKYFVDFTQLLSVIGEVAGRKQIAFSTVSADSSDDLGRDNNTDDADSGGSDGDDSGSEGPNGDTDSGNSDSNDPDNGDSDGGDSDSGNSDGSDTSELGSVDFSNINEVVGVQWPEYDSEIFQVIQHFPAGNLPLIDFSTLHFMLSHEIDPNTVVMDQSFFLVKEGESTSTAGQLLVKGKNISFDPDEDLEGGATYLLTFTNDIKSIDGKRLKTDGYTSLALVPQTTHPRLGVIQKIKGLESGDASPVNGITRNSVQVDSKLIGQSMSYADGDYHVELANLAAFTDSMPFIIRKGSIIRMSSMDVNIGGAIPAGYETETLFLTLTTDAVGYLTNSDILLPYEKRRLTMLMDTSMIAENPKANGALSQDLLNVTLTGFAGFSDGILEVDAVGDIEVELLGLETAKSTATFFLEAYADQDNAPLKEVDVTAPQLQHWIPADNTNRFQLTDSILLTFNEGLETRNLSEEIHLVKASGEVVDTNIRQDGSVIIIDPVNLLESGTAYEVRLSSNVKDMAGNTLEEAMNLSFTTQAIDDSSLAAPLLSSVYPGYNCRFTDPDYVNNIAGRCSGGHEEDDKFSIFTLPKNRSIHVEFNQPMDINTIHLGEECGTGNFRVEKIDENRNCIAGVSGSLSMSATGFSFKPNNGWEEGVLYRYSLYSAKESSCTGTDNVPCSIYGLPLNPKPLKIKNDNRWEGGNSIHMPFRVVPEETTLVLNPLRQVPTADVNRNFSLDSSESAISENSAALRIGGFAGLVKEAYLGCKSGSCEDQQAIYVSGSIPTDVGQYDAENKRIPVYMYPQALMTTSIIMYTKVILGMEVVAPTGPQVMRMRGDQDENGNVLPYTIGYISWDEESQQAVINATMNVYLDAPGLAPKILGIELHTNMHSLPLTIELEGPVNFMEDGRMEISLSNTEEVDIDVLIESFLGDSDVFLKIPKDALSINMVSKMTKN